MNASLRSQGQDKVGPPVSLVGVSRSKIQLLLAVGFNGQIRKGTPFSLDSARQGEEEGGRRGRCTTAWERKWNW